VAEGSVASLEEAPDTVPVRDLLAVKDKNHELKSELKARDERIKALEEALKQAPTGDVETQFADVDPRFIKGITEKAKKEAIAEMEAILAKQNQSAEFSRKLDDTLEKQLIVARQNGVKIPENVDKSLLKALALQNPKEPISVLAERLYGVDMQAKATTENDARPAMDYVTEDVDLRKITPEQQERIMADPKARKAYFAALDKAGI
jgi:hypothetical protein